MTLIFLFLLRIGGKEKLKYFKKNFAEINRIVTFATPMKKGEAGKPEDL